MKIGIIGLGKMGGNIVKRLLNMKHDVLIYDVDKTLIDKYAQYGAFPTYSIEELCNSLDNLKIIWLMIPAGKPTDETVRSLEDYLNKDDIIIDGGNTLYCDSIKRAKELKKSGINLLDVGTSGGIWGLQNGFCLMIGGDYNSYLEVEPIFKDLATKNGYSYMGKSGAGHYVKMIHNGIEYGLMQAYAEGFELLHNKDEFNLDLNKIANLWNNGSVIRSWLLELSENIFKDNESLDHIKGFVTDSGEGRWTVNEAIAQNVSAPIITLSLMQRFRSRKIETFSDKILASLRNQFGGHDIKKEV